MGNKKPQAIDWKSRIVGHGKQPADQFLHHPDNPKYHPENQRAALAGAISEIGFISPVIVNRTTGYLIDGHERVFLALDTNAEVDYIEVELSPDEEAYALVTLDPIGHLARHDSAKLDALLRDVQTGDEAVMTMLSELAEANGVIPIESGMWGDAFEKVPTDDREPFQGMTFTLHDEQVTVINAALGKAKKAGDFTDSPNENSNGNALWRVCDWYLKHG